MYGITLDEIIYLQQSDVNKLTLINCPNKNHSIKIEGFEKAVQREHPLYYNIIS